MRQKQRREWLDDIKNVPCMDCGSSFPACAMDFDHRDPLVKKYSIGSALMDTTIDELITEISKCDIVCANCHRIRTHITRKEVQ